MIPLRDDIRTTVPPVVTIGLIVSCVLVFLWQQSYPATGQELIAYSLGLVPATLFGDKQLPPELQLVPPGATLLTSMFLHGGWMHLLGNMLYLWIFGNNVEAAMGHGRYLAFYLVCGLLAALAQALPDPDSTLPMIGASGAISGVLGAYLLLHPSARVLVLVPIGIIIEPLWLPAVLVLGVWFLLQLVSGLLSSSGEGGVAFMAHIGGFIAGMGLVPLFKRREVRLLVSRRRG